MNMRSAKLRSNTDLLSRALQMTRILILPHTLLPPHLLLTHLVVNLGLDGAMALLNQMASPESTLHSRPPRSQQPLLMPLISRPLPLYWLRFHLCGLRRAPGASGKARTAPMYTRSSPLL